LPSAELGWDELLRRMPPERMDAAVRMHAT